MNSIKRERQDRALTDIDTPIIRNHRAPSAPSTWHGVTVIMLATVIVAGLSVALVAGFAPSDAPAIALRPSVKAATASEPLPGGIASPDRVLDAQGRAQADERAAQFMAGYLEFMARKRHARLIETVIGYALAQQGDRYVFGTAGPNTFDCSGLVLAAFHQVGIELYHYTGVMLTKGTPVSRDEMQRGDIVFPSSGHVAIYLGNGMMIAASSGQGKVVVQKVYAFYAARRLV